MSDSLCPLTQELHSCTLSTAFPSSVQACTGVPDHGTGQANRKYKTYIFNIITQSKHGWVNKWQRTSRWMDRRTDGKNKETLYQNTIYFLVNKKQTKISRVSGVTKYRMFEDIHKLLQIYYLGRWPMLQTALCYVANKPLWIDLSHDIRVFCSSHWSR